MTISIQNYSDLIQSLPVSAQAFTVKANSWQGNLSDIHFKEIFKVEENICLSRKEVHDTNNIGLFILKTIVWGYPKGMRGNNFGKIYSRLNDLSEILNIPNRSFLKTDDLYELQKRLKAIDGLGLSTYSKTAVLPGF